jgi:hypothetical protein
VHTALIHTAVSHGALSHGVLSHAGLVAGITWDPFIRGVLIVAAAIVLLPGSVYLVLSTNVGARLGLLLAGAGASGLLCILAILWMVLSSTADVGRVNSWVPLQIVTGDYAGQVTVKSAQDFPTNDLTHIRPTKGPLPTKHWFWPLQSCRDTGWRQVDPAKITDPESAGDRVLVPATTGVQIPPELTSPFSATTDYVYLGAYEKGANSACLFAINRHKIYLPFTRPPHLAMLVLKPVIPVPTTTGGVPPKPRPDLTKPSTYVILERNLGSVRQPQLIVAIWSGIIFLILCNVLHRRDKEIWARQAAEREAAAAPPPGSRSDSGAAGEARQPVGASP